MKKMWVWLFFMCIPHVFGATLYGSLYDLSLEPVEKAVVTINTNPIQRVVTTNGTYAFTLSPGKYTIEALYQDASKTLFTSEIISIDQINQHYDLILFTQLNSSIYDDLDIPIEDLDYSSSNAYEYLLLTIIVSTAFGIYYFKKKSTTSPRSSLDPSLQHIISILQSHNNRMLQKDLRKEVGYSEAKLSLELVELENLGLIKKIKKGRGNIIRLS